MTIDEVRQVAGPVCALFSVKRPDLFGSLARGDAGPASDVDLLVEFDRPDEDPPRRSFGLLHHLEDSLGCSVDLLTTTGLRNPYFRRKVQAEKRLIYGR